MSASQPLPKVMQVEEVDALPSIESTIAFIQQAHAGKDYKPGMPYWQLPVAVMKRLPANATHEEKLAALLHDVLEDTSYTREQLLDMGYSPLTLDIVQAVSSKLPSEPLSDADFVKWYRGTIQALVDGSKKVGPDGHLLCFDMVAHRGALRLKLADNQENMDPESLLELPAARRAWCCTKYAGVEQMLKDGLRDLETQYERCSQR